MKVSIGQAAKEFGVSIATLRRWEAQGKIQPERTPNGHRRDDLVQLRGLKPYETSQTTRPSLGYTRVSSPDQKEDLVRQVPQLIRRICSGSVGRLVLTNPDRWLRFGSELIWSLCESFHSEVVILHPGEQPLSFEEELAQDGLEIIPVFSAHLYGSHKNRP